MIVGVLGSGVMGVGITALLMKSDCIDLVRLLIRNMDHIDAAVLKVSRDIKRYCKKNKIDENAILSKLVVSDNLQEFSDVDLFVEAVPEDMAIKEVVIRDVSNIAKEGAIFASNTSSLSITALSMFYKQPQDFIGMHFFNPTSVMELVEVVQGLNTSPRVVQNMIDLSLSLGKKPVQVLDSPGFVVNRMLIPMINEAVAILAEGVANKNDIDTAMKLGANHPLGPLSLSDLIGNDVCLSIMETLYAETGDPKYRAHPLLRQYVRAGYLGKKVKKGFYDYGK